LQAIDGLRDALPLQGGERVAALERGFGVACGNQGGPSPCCSISAVAARKISASLLIGDPWFL
jgi:hypothetical protein